MIDELSQRFFVQIALRPAESARVHLPAAGRRRDGEHVEQLVLVVERTRIV